MKIFVTSDSSCDLSQEQLKEYNINIIPLYVNLNGQEYKDGIDITPDDIFAFVKETKKLPKTAAISMDDYLTFFKQLLNNDDDARIIHIGIGSKLSTSYNNAVNASNELNGKVKVIDGNNLSTGTGLLVLYAAKLAKEGQPFETIIEKVEKRVPNVQASFIIQEMDYLYKGGRCSALQLFGANLLKIKPRIEVLDGAMKNTDKPRGKMNIVLKQYVDKILTEYNNPDKEICFVTHSCLEDEIVKEIVEYVKSKNLFKEVVETVAGATITSHCGKGTLGVLYINDGGKL